MREEFYRPKKEKFVGKTDMSASNLGPVTIPLKELSAAYTHVLKKGATDLWDMIFGNLDNPVTVPAARPGESSEAW